MRALYILAVMTAVPSSSFAQAAIAGSVKDGSGLPLLGVIVQATSPVLIEKSRLALTDGRGHYRMENLRPGTYAIGFALNGWKTYQRDGIELSGSSTVVVNAELTLGAVAEAITAKTMEPRGSVTPAIVMSS